MKKCAIAIPIWKRAINGFELNSLIQCRCVLGQNADYDILFFGPDGVHEKYYRGIWETFKADESEFTEIIRFPDRCFESRLSYSHLLTCKEFYSRFSDKYENILIYQLDAWVFKDELSEWCDSDYDYIGAPWCHLCRIGKKDGCDGMKSFVGNGGLSLRKVRTMVEKLPYDTFDDALYNESLNEDTYIGLCGNDIKRPICSVAAKFSVETNASALIGTYGIPFGFHGLNAYDGALFEKLTSETFKGKEILKNAGR